MSKSQDNSMSNSVGGCITMLQIIFIVLKLCKAIDWSWHWVLAPTWMSICGILLMLIVFLIIIIIFNI